MASFSRVRAPVCAFAAAEPTGNARRQRAAGAAGTASARRWHPRSAPINYSAAPCSRPAVVDALAARTLVKGEPPHPALHEDKARSAAHVQE